MGKIRVGDVVEVRSKEEVLATLDRNDAFEGLLFAPEMFQFCGSRFKVLERLTTIMIEGVGIRQISDTVILKNAFCDGKYHSDCARTCVFLWKEQWLRRPSPNPSDTKNSSAQQIEKESGIYSRNTFSCQATSLIRSTKLPSKLPIKKYLLEARSDSLRPIEIIRTMIKSIRLLTRRLVLKERVSLAGVNIRTPTSSLNLQSGELVEVRNIEEIIRSLDREGKNRGLAFTKEMVKYCGKRFKVLKRIDKMINEATGSMRQIANTVILDGAVCDGEAHGGCARNCYCLWREIWLERVHDSELIPVKQTN